MMTIKRPREQRSTKANAYYWAAVVTPAAEYFGYFPDEMHEAFKMKFLVEHGENGFPDKVKSTRRLHSDEFRKYIEDIRMWLQIDYGFKTEKESDFDAGE
jgi:hypothetical protein